MGKRIRLGLSLVLLTGVFSCAVEDEPKKNPDLAGMPDDVTEAVQKANGVEVAALSEDGVPGYVAGDFGRFAPRMDARLAESAMRSTLAQIAPMFRLSPENLRFTRQRVDELGARHMRYRQIMNGLDVVGGELIVHVDSRGMVNRANGSARGFDVSATPTIGSDIAIGSLRGRAEYAGMSVSPARLVYVLSNLDLKHHLAWEATVTGDRSDHPVIDVVYIDAHSGRIADIHPRIYTAKNREIHNLNGGTTLPGPVARTEGQAANADAQVNASYTHLGTVYDCYSAMLGRDSIDGAGMKMISSVHYSTNYVNAYWNGTQMVYGDGNGTDASPLSDALDIAAHELSHGVTSSESNLAYSGQSGGLNEAYSDIAGAFCEWFRDGKPTSINGNNWKMGEEVWTPATPGDALRYMNDPAFDGASLDYYPDYSSGVDVHYSSGIANLQFYLAVSGGTHPRNKTTNPVVGAGMQNVAKIWYKANADEFTASTTFAQARLGTKKAAEDLFGVGSVEAKAIEDAWTAVGVQPPPPPPVPVAMAKGEAKLISAALGEGKAFFLDVPAGATNVTFTLSGGLAGDDADLYVKFGQEASPTLFDGKSETVTSTESVVLSKGAGRYYAFVNAYSKYTNVTVKADYTPGSGGGVLTNGVPTPSLSGAAASTTLYTIAVPANVTSLIFRTAGGTGDADLYVKNGAAPTTESFDYRSWGGTNSEQVNVTGTLLTGGTWYVMVHGYSAYSGLSLTATYATGTSQEYQNLAATKGSWTSPYYMLVVPAGATNISFTTTGGTGDADLYTKLGSVPTLTSYTCRPYTSSNTETCTVASSPNGGTYYVRLYAFANFSGVTLKLSYTR